MYNVHRADWENFAPLSDTQKRLVFGDLPDIAGAFLYQVDRDRNKKTRIVFTHKD